MKEEREGIDGVEVEFSFLVHFIRLTKYRHYTWHKAFPQKNLERMTG
jgi:hypothetical protein